MKSKMAKAIRYTLGHWGGLTLFLADGRVEVDSNTIERYHARDRDARVIVHLLFKYLETLGVDHRRRVQVGGTDLERRARNNLLGAKNAGFDQLAEPMAGDAALRRRLAKP